MTIEHIDVESLRVYPEDRLHAYAIHVLEKEQMRIHKLIDKLRIIHQGVAGRDETARMKWRQLQKDKLQAAIDDLHKVRNVASRRVRMKAVK